MAARGYEEGLAGEIGISIAEGAEDNNEGFEGDDLVVGAGEAMGEGLDKGNDGNGGGFGEKDDLSYEMVVDRDLIMEGGL